MPIPRLPRLPIPLQFAISIPPLVLTAWWWFTYSGPYRWLAEWQIRKWGMFYQAMTFLVVAGVPVVLAALLIHLGCWLTGFHFDPQRTQESAERWRTWHAERRYRIGLLCVGLVVVVLGGHGYYVGKTAGALSRMNVAELEKDLPPSSGWLELRGNLLHDRAAHWKIEDKNRTEVYVPLVSDAWEPGQPVAVIILARDKRAEDRLFENDTAPVDGLVEPLGLPGHVRTTLEDNGVRLVDNPILIEYRANPEVQTLLGTVGLALGGAMMLISALIWLVKRDSLLPARAEAPAAEDGATFPAD
jgi:hypothetical protein